MPEVAKQRINSAIRRLAGSQNAVGVMRHDEEKSDGQRAGCRDHLGRKGASEAALTPKEVLGMLRRHLWLILFVTILGGTVGTGGWYLVRRYLPLYRAETVIKVLPPVDTDPMEIVVAQVQQDIQYGHRVSLANLMKSQSTLQELLQARRGPQYEVVSPDHERRRGRGPGGPMSGEESDRVSASRGRAHRRLDDVRQSERGGPDRQ